MSCLTRAATASSSPVFFVVTGVRLDLHLLFANATNLARAPIFLTASVIACGLPALVYRSLPTRAQKLGTALFARNLTQRPGRCGSNRCRLDLHSPAVHAAL